VTLFDDTPNTGARRVTLVKLSAEMARSLAGIGRIAVEGEVHRPSKRPGGRVFFTLKDRAAQITVTCPGARAKRCRTVAGERVLVTGTLEWVSGWGALQIVAEEVVPVGVGAVAAMIDDARRRLLADGLVDRPRRRIPRLPGAIGVVCGSDAAVRADIESVVAARFPGYPVIFREVTVSGPGAADAVIGAIDDLSRREGVGVIVLARGGGDATQLLPFSDEALCRAICAAPVPVVSAIGHEGDRPLCDDVADLRCGTPSLAAAAVVPDRMALEAELVALAARAEAVAQHRLQQAVTRLSSIDRDRAALAGVGRAGERLARAGGRLELLHPQRGLSTASAQLARLDPRPPVDRRLERSRTSLAAAQRQLEALDPVRVLERGYAVVRAGDRVVRNSDMLSPGEAIEVQLASGSLSATVEEVR
jgi:exodeoxyribonuclease VII large subunit